MAISRVKMAMIGLKGINDWHYLPGIRNTPAAELVGGVDLQPEARAKFQEKTGLPAYETMAELVKELQPEAVIIGTPNPAHLPNIREAVNFGLHMSVTKPLCNTVAECNEAVRLAKTANLVLQVGHEYRFRPSVSRALQLVKEGALGEITMVTAHMGSSAGLQKLTAAGMWRSQAANVPGGCLNLLGVHMFDVLNAILGNPLAVSAQLRRLVSTSELEDTAAVLIEYENGRIGVVTSSYVSAPSDCIHILGTTGNAVATEAALNLEREPKPWARETVLVTDLPATGSAERVIDQFCAAIRGNAALQTPGEAGLLAVALNEAAVISQREGGRRVALAELIGGAR